MKLIKELKKDKGLMNLLVEELVTRAFAPSFDPIMYHHLLNVLGAKSIGNKRTVK